MNAELLRQEKEKKQASKTDRLVISQAQVIGIRELAKLKKTKEMAEDKTKTKKGKREMDKGKTPILRTKESHLPSDIGHHNSGSDFNRCESVIHLAAILLQPHI